jgi:predicted RNA polymerase sigma factor
LQIASHRRIGLEADRALIVRWAAVVDLYDARFALDGSVVVAINRAVAAEAYQYRDQACGPT